MVTNVIFDKLFSSFHNTNSFIFELLFMRTCQPGEFERSVTFAEISVLRAWHCKFSKIRDCHAKSVTYDRSAVDIFHQNSSAELNRKNSKLRSYKLIKSETRREIYLRVCGFSHFLTRFFGL